MAVGPTLTGHSLLNWALAHTEAYRVNLAVLLEPVLASFWTWLFIGERPPLHVLPGAALVLAALALEFLPAAKRTVTSTHGGDTTVPELRLGVGSGRPSLAVQWIEKLKVASTLPPESLASRRHGPIMFLATVMLDHVRQLAASDREIDAPEFLVFKEPDVDDLVGAVGHLRKTPELPDVG